MTGDSRLTDGEQAIWDAAVEQFGEPEVDNDSVPRLVLAQSDEIFDSMADFYDALEANVAAGNLTPEEVDAFLDFGQAAILSGEPRTYLTEHLGYIDHPSGRIAQIRFPGPGING